MISQALRSIAETWRNSALRRLRIVLSSLALGVAATLLVVFVLQGLSLFHRAELAAYDIQYHLRGARSMPANIVVVQVDQTSLDDLGNGAVVQRHYVASAVDFLHQAGAKAIGLDFRYITASSPRDDSALAAAIRRAGNVVLAEDLQGADATNYVATETSLEAPIDSFARHAAGAGLVNYPVDPDGEIRQALLSMPGPGGQSYPLFPAVLASVALHRSLSAVVHGLPQDLLINYVGEQQPLAFFESRASFRTTQFESLAKGQDSPSVYRDKIVLIVPGAIGLNDVHNTPFGQMYGGFINANTLVTILDRNPIQAVGGRTNSWIVLLMGLLTAYAASRWGILRSVAAGILLAVGYVPVTVLLFSTYRVWINVVTPETAVVLTFAAVIALRFATEERKRRYTARVFGEYVKPEIVDILVNTPEAEKALAGARRPISVLFVDVRGFTAMSEQMEPEDVVRALDVYLEQLTLSVEDFQGTLDKYVGDELMAIWNAPRYQENHALLAVQSALDMIARMDRINEQLLAQGLPAIGYGVGVNSGEAVVGRMGSSIRKQYDVIGDTVNTAARLCSAAGRGEIIIGETTWEMIGDRLLLEETEPLRLKGKRRPFRTFRVLGIAPDTQATPQPAPSPA
jgi:adenylate cyclase